MIPDEVLIKIAPIDLIVFQRKNLLPRDLPQPFHDIRVQFCHTEFKQAFQTILLTILRWGPAEIEFFDRKLPV
jgi:hypothetical protein